jgi:arylsulfatase A-like enzyme
LLDVLLGKSKKGREQMIEEAFTMSLRMGNWKYIAPQTKPTPSWLANKDVASGLQKTPQLYNLNKDPKEDNNLANKYPERVAQMAKNLSIIMGNSN